eukprot:6214638-Pleurochrysis_carterae.AAC.6
MNITSLPATHAHPHASRHKRTLARSHVDTLTRSHARARTRTGSFAVRRSPYLGTTAASVATAIGNSDAARRAARRTATARSARAGCKRCPAEDARSLAGRGCIRLQSSTQLPCATIRIVSVHPVPVTKPRLQRPAEALCTHKASVAIASLHPEEEALHLAVLRLLCKSVCKEKSVSVMSHRNVLGYLGTSTDRKVHFCENPQKCTSIPSAPDLDSSCVQLIRVLPGFVSLLTHRSSRDRRAQKGLGVGFGHGETKPRSSTRGKGTEKLTVGRRGQEKKKQSAGR